MCNPFLLLKAKVMKLIDNFYEIEHNRNKYLSLRLNFAGLQQTFAGLLPEREEQRRYVDFIKLFLRVRRLQRPFACGSFCAMQPDIEKYRRYLDQFDIDEDKKIGLIHTMWNMMESFVDRAFGDDPVQHSAQSNNTVDSRWATRVLESTLGNQGEKRNADRSAISTGEGD